MLEQVQKQRVQPVVTVQAQLSTMVAHTAVLILPMVVYQRVQRHTRTVQRAVARKVSVT